MREIPNYDELKKFAALKRVEHNVTTSGLDLNVVRRIYRAEGVRMDPWPFPRTIRAAYMCDDADPSVAINKTLPREPKLFSLVHELKHHFFDRQRIVNGEIRCGDYNANQSIEVGAEVFAAEFIYPEQEFLDCVRGLGIGIGLCTPEEVVRLKRECGAVVSYVFLQKRLVRLGFAVEARFRGVKFQKLEEAVYGVPIYKQQWFKERRALRH